jgi:hypothetical protein
MDFTFATAFRSTMGPTKISVGYWGSFYQGVMRLGCETDRSPRPSAEVKNVRCYTSTFPHAFRAWCLIKHRDNQVEVFWAVTPCSFMVGYQRFGGLCRVHLLLQAKDGGSMLLLKRWYNTTTQHWTTTLKTSTWIVATMRAWNIASSTGINSLILFSVAVIYLISS